MVALLLIGNWVGLYSPRKIIVCHQNIGISCLRLRKLSQYVNCHDLHWGTCYNVPQWSPCFVRGTLASSTVRASSTPIFSRHCSAPPIVPLFHPCQGFFFTQVPTNDTFVHIFEDFLAPGCWYHKLRKNPATIWCLKLMTK